MENVLEGLKSTNQSLAQLLICFKSLLSVTAAVFGIICMFIILYEPVDDGLVLVCWCIN